MASTAGLAIDNPGCSLLMCNVPATCTFKYFNVVKIRNFHLPIKLKDCGYLRMKKNRAVWMVEFFTKEDMESAFEEVQMKEFEGLSTCLVLVRPEEFMTFALAGDWNHIHRDLQVDILSHFDVFGRCRLRRVCRKWDEVLQAPWDKEVNRCLYLDLSRAITGRYFGHTFETLLAQVDRASANRCGRIGRLVLKFSSHAKTSGVRWAPGRPFSCRDACLDETFLARYLLKHRHFNTVMLIGLRLQRSDLIRRLFCFNGTSRWPTNLKVIYHNCNIRMAHCFPASSTSDQQFSKYGSFTAREHEWNYEIEVQNFAVLIGPESTQETRYVGLIRKLEEDGCYWPFPTGQLDWLKNLLQQVPVDEDFEDLNSTNAEGNYSLRQAIRRYFQNDWTRKMVGRWKPTGVYFERTELNWRDCFFLALLTVRRALLGPQLPPQTVEHCVLLRFAPDDKNPVFKIEQSNELEAFNTGLAGLRNDGPDHCITTS